MKSNLEEFNDEANDSIIRSSTGINREDYKAIQLPTVRPARKKSSTGQNYNPHNFTIEEIEAYAKKVLKGSGQALSLNKKILDSYSVSEGYSIFLMPPPYHTPKLIHKLWSWGRRQSLKLTPFAQKEILARRNSLTQNGKQKHNLTAKTSLIAKTLEPENTQTVKLKVSKIQVLNYFSSISYTDEKLKIIVLVIANNFNENTQTAFSILIKDVNMSRIDLHFALENNSLSSYWDGFTGEINKTKLDKRRRFKLSPKVVKLILLHDLDHIL